MEKSCVPRDSAIIRSLARSRQPQLANLVQTIPNNWGNELEPKRKWRTNPKVALCCLYKCAVFLNSTLGYRFVCPSSTFINIGFFFSPLV